MGDLEHITPTCTYTTTNNDDGCSFADFYIRPLQAKDIEEVASLHREWFPVK